MPHWHAPKDIAQSPIVRMTLVVGTIRPTRAPRPVLPHRIGRRPLLVFPGHCLSPDQFHDRYAITLHPHTAGPATATFIEDEWCPIHAQRRVVKRGHLRGGALDVVPDECATEAIGRGVGVTAVDQRTVEEQHVAGGFRWGVLRCGML